MHDLREDPKAHNLAPAAVNLEANTSDSSVRERIGEESGYRRNKRAHLNGRFMWRLTLKLWSCLMIHICGWFRSHRQFLQVQTLRRCETKRPSCPHLQERIHVERFRL